MALQAGPVTLEGSDSECRAAVNKLIVELILVGLLILGGAMLAASDKAWLRRRMRTDLFEPDARLVALHYLVIRVTGVGLLLIALFAAWRLMSGLSR
ncbi:MAG: hypothetical protein JWM33_3540 [Caulobacteraceae bacterium]|nr:hypothetical protein [Caulobacteraceae bacterium]